MYQLIMMVIFFCGSFYYLAQALGIIELKIKPNWDEEKVSTHRTKLKIGGFAMLGLGIVYTYEYLNKTGILSL